MSGPTAYEASLVRAWTTLELARQQIADLSHQPAMRALLRPQDDAVTPMSIATDIGILRDWVYSQMGAS